MTPEELALEVARVALEKSRVEMYKDLVKVGIPSFVAILSALFSARLAYLLKKSDQKNSEKERGLKIDLANLEAKFTSSESLLVSKRTQIEEVSKNHEVFANSIAIFYTQVIAKLVKIEKGEDTTSEFEERLKSYEDKNWNSYVEANKAKRILELNGFFDTSEKLIAIMSHASEVRSMYQSFVKGEYEPSSNTIDEHFQNFRKFDKEFLRSLNQCYEGLVINVE